MRDGAETAAVGKAPPAIVRAFPEFWHGWDAFRLRRRRVGAHEHAFDMEREEISHYFREIFRFSKDCRYTNCTHTHEPGCAVLRALDEHLIAASRYNSYLSMLGDEDEGKYR